MKIFGGVIGLIILITVAVFLSHMNKVPTYDENVKGAWSQVQNQYKRRADLIPNLVATVKGYAKHEKDVFIDVTQARSKVGQMTISADALNDPKAFAKFEQAQNALSSSLSKLMMVSERYPDLKSDKNFLALQSQLEGTENRISVARRDYISTVRIYNIELRTIPGKWIASYLYPDARTKATFTASPIEQNTPKVQF